MSFWPARAKHRAPPFSTPMMTPRKAATLAHLGIHISWRASRQRSCEPTESRAGTWRKATIPLEKCLVRPMGRDRGANAAGCHLYVRAGRGCDWASTACCRSLPFSPPCSPPGTSPAAPLCVCFCVCFCAVCALRDVSPRDRWLCVLPGWQMNVNVNVNVVLAAICGFVMRT